MKFGCSLVFLASFVFAAGAAEREVMTFPVADGGFYHVRVATTGAGATLRFGFRDADGQDLEPTERALGYPVSAQTAKLEKDGEVVLEARAGGKTGTTAAQGVVSLSGSDAVRVVSAAWFAGEVRGLAARGGVRGLAARTQDGAPLHSGAGNFARNLLANPSFEEVADGKPAHWRFSGAGEARLVRESYAGDWAIQLTEAEQGSRWLSDAFPVAPGGRLEMLFAIRFSRHANPGEHVCPVMIEFLDAKGRVVPHAKRSAFAFNYYRPHLMSDWGVMSVSPHLVPANAVQARVVLRFNDREGKHVIGWGDVFVDNIAVWQTDEAVDVPFAVSGIFGASQLLAKTKPPQLPAGDRRNGSVWAVQPVTDDFNLFFSREGAPSVELAFANLLGYDRAISLRGTMKDPDGKELGPVEATVALAPYELKRQALAVAAPTKFGVYTIDYALFDGEAPAGSGTASFAWLDHRPNVSLSERRSIDYPFDMHPSGGLNFRSYAHYSDDVREADLKLAALLGVGGMRLQMRQTQMDPDPEKNAALARRDVAEFRERVLPHFRRHGLRCWPTFMEQDPRTYFPRGEADSAAWKAYWRAFGEAISNDVEFLLFGNEGIGGYTVGFGLDEDLTKRSAYHGTIRQWANAYRGLREAVHETNPSLPVGFSMAADLTGQFTKFLYDSFPDLCREVWAMNGYVRPWEMVANCARAMGDEQAQAFGAMPEMSYDSGNPDWDARCREAAEALAMTYLDVKAANPRMRRLAWFMQRTPDRARFGVYSYSYQPRPAAVAYAVMTDTLGAGRVARTVRLPDGGRFHVWERLDGRRVGLGFSPNGMSVVASAKGGVTKMDVYGNREAVAAADGEAVLKLASVPTYFLGEGLDVPERFAVACAAAETNAADRATVVVRVANRTAKPLALEVAADFKPALVVAEPVRKVALAAGEAKELAFDVRFAGTDGSRAYAQTFTAKDENGFGVSVAAELRFAERTARNLLANGDFGADDGKGGVVGWEPRVTFQPGRPKTEVRFLRKAGLGPDGASCVAMVLGPEPTHMAQLRLTQRVALKPGARYYLSVKSQSQKNSAWWAHTEAEVRDAKGRVVSRPSFAALKEAELGEWSVYEGGFVAPAEVATLDFTLLVTNAKYGEVRYARAELLEVE